MASFRLFASPRNRAALVKRGARGGSLLSFLQSLAQGAQQFFGSLKMPGWLSSLGDRIRGLFSSRRAPDTLDEDWAMYGPEGTAYKKGFVPPSTAGSPGLTAFAFDPGALELDAPPPPALDRRAAAPALNRPAGADRPKRGDAPSRSARQFEEELRARNLEWEQLQRGARKRRPR